jgi:hypothetical protein
MRYNPPMSAEDRSRRCVRSSPIGRAREEIWRRGVLRMLRVRWLSRCALCSVAMRW